MKPLLIILTLLLCGCAPDHKYVLKTVPYNVDDLREYLGIQKDEYVSADILLARKCFELEERIKRLEAK